MFFWSPLARSWLLQPAGLGDLAERAGGRCRTDLLTSAHWEHALSPWGGFAVAGIPAIGRISPRNASVSYLVN